MLAALLVVLLVLLVSGLRVALARRRWTTAGRRPAAASRRRAGGAGREAGARGPTLYVVKRGDTLYSIALEHGVDFRELARWNNLDDPSKIRVGQELRVRAPEEPAAAQVGSARASRDIESRPLEPGAARRPPPLPRLRPPRAG